MGDTYENQDGRPSQPPVTRSEAEHYNQEPSGDASQYNYENHYNREPEGAGKSSSTGNGFAIASLVLGIVAVVGFCSCINIPIAILGIIFGIIHLVQHGKNGMAIAGIITSGVSILLFVIFMMLYSLAIFSSSTQSMFNDYYDYYDYYEDELPSYQDTY